jgi:hypothetical protein
MMLLIAEGLRRVSKPWPFNDSMDTLPLVGSFSVFIHSLSAAGVEMGKIIVNFTQR